MIKIAEADINKDTFLSEHPKHGIELDILNILFSSTQTYSYTSLEQLQFELTMRGYIIEAAYNLYRGRLRFSIFRKSECNGDFWVRMDDGGFEIKGDVKPSKGISDIFRHTHLYSTECATAIVMVYYKAILDIYGAETFDRVFPHIVLMNWMHLDNPADILTYRDSPDFFPGDCRYFKNPDVNPLTPEWQGENAIEMGDGTYYGHGIGIRNDTVIIAALNKNRIEGSEVSAYLMKTATRPSFKSLFIRMK
jgi:protein-glutamine gamma-glutamyltransferase